MKKLILLITIALSGCLDPMAPNLETRYSSDIYVSGGGDVPCPNCVIFEVFQNTLMNIIVSDLGAVTAFDDCNNGGAWAFTSLNEQSLIIPDTIGESATYTIFRSAPSNNCFLFGENEFFIEKTDENEYELALNGIIFKMRKNLYNPQNPQQN